MELHEFSLWALTKFLCWRARFFVYYQMQQCYCKYSLYNCKEKSHKNLVNIQQKQNLKIQQKYLNILQRNLNILQIIWMFSTFCKFWTKDPPNDGSVNGSVISSKVSEKVRSNNFFETLTSYMWYETSWSEITLFWKWFLLRLHVICNICIIKVPLWLTNIETSQTWGWHLHFYSNFFVYVRVPANLIEGLALWSDGLSLLKLIHNLNHYGNQTPV